MTPPPSSPRSSRGRRIAEFAVDHPGEVLLAAGAVAYFLGYLALRLFAGGLGVSPSDFNLSYNEYLISATAWLLVLIPYIAASIWVSHLAYSVGWRSVTGFFAVAGAVGVAVVVVVIAATEISSGAALAVLIAIGLSAFVGWWWGGTSLFVILAVASALIAMVLLYAHPSARELSEHPATATPPLYVRLVLTVEEGTAEFKAGSECVLRFSDRVYVTTATVRVEPAGVPFQPGDCFTYP